MAGPPGGPAGAMICIPVQNSDEVVAVPLDELPEDPEELLEVREGHAA